MKKRILSFVLILVLCLSMAMPVLADEPETGESQPAEPQYIYDIVSLLTEEEAQQLNEQADAIFQEHGISIYFVLTRGTNKETLYRELEKFYADANGAEIGLAAAIDKQSGNWDIYAPGDTQLIVRTEEKDTLFKAFNEPETWYEGVHNFIEVSKEMLVPYVTGEKDVTDLPPLPTPEPEEPLRALDLAGVLTGMQRETLELRLEDIRERQNVDIVVAVVESLEGKDIESYSEEFFDVYGYGIGPDQDGIVLLLSMEEREWVITANGYGNVAINDDAREYIAELMVAELRNEDYSYAFTVFIEKCDELLTQAKAGNIYEKPEPPFEIGKNLLISFGIALVIALIVVSSMKGKLKSVKKQDAAADDVKSGSLNLTQAHERFLYHTVSRTAIPKNTSSDSSGRSSSGSSSRGSTSGKF